jgi:hypothetical protein
MFFYLKDNIETFNTEAAGDKDITSSIMSGASQAATTLSNTANSAISGLPALKYDADEIYKSMSLYNDLPPSTTVDGIIGQSGASLNEASLAAQQGLAESRLNGYLKITDPIPASYLPYTETISDDPKIRSYDSDVIDTYVKLLNRQPTNEELNIVSQQLYNNEIDIEILKMRLINSPEFEINSNMQSNEVNSRLLTAVSSNNLVKYLMAIYKNTLNKEPPRKILQPLKDCYIHLRYNDYLFIAMLLNANYFKFETDVIETAILSKELLLEYFNKYFVLLELKSKANIMKKEDIMRRKVAILNEPNASGSNGTSSTGTASGAKSSIGSCPWATIDTETSMGSEENIKKIVKDGNNVFNINIKLNDTGRMSSTPYKRDESGDTSRIYNPIDYKQHYRGQANYVPPVCTSAGNKNIVQPVFLNSKLLLSATELDEAANNTGMGSIMPKFEYKEFEEVPKVKAPVITTANPPIVPAAPIAIAATTPVVPVA